jgi:hypothetical protein
MSDEVGLDASELPQFHGKWTFSRIFGIQEPASAIFSALNLLATFVAWRKYCRSVLVTDGIKSALVDDSYFVITTISAILGMNAWLWSTVFHIHDFPITEKLDYFSAFSVVLFSFYSVFIRVLEDHLSNLFNSGRLLVHITIPCGIPFLAYYVYHVHFLAYQHFDYGYNMNANLIAGCGSSFLWLYWSFRQLYVRTLSNSSKGNKYIETGHIKKGIFCIIALNAFLLFELLDFAPLWFTFDAHSLWHLATIPVPFYWLSFLSDEAIAKHHSRNILKDSKSNGLNGLIHKSTDNLIQVKKVT